MSIKCKLGMHRWEKFMGPESAGDGKFALSGTVQRSGVPQGWMDILPLYVETEGRTIRLGFVRALKDTTTFEVQLPYKPDKVLLNHNEDIFAEIKQ